MKRLPEAAKNLIVRELACFKTPSEVAEIIRGHFGISVSRQAIECYHPHRCAGQALSEKWIAIFQETRLNFIKQVGAIGVSHKAVRLQALQSALGRADRAGNISLALRILSAAARESP